MYHIGSKGYTWKPKSVYVNALTARSIFSPGDVNEEMLEMHLNPRGTRRVRINKILRGHILAFRSYKKIGNKKYKQVKKDVTRKIKKNVFYIRLFHS